MVNSLVYGTTQKFVGYKLLIFWLRQYSDNVADWKPRNQIWNSCKFKDFSVLHNAWTVPGSTHPPAQRILEPYYQQ